MISAQTIDRLRFLAVALAFPTQERLLVAGALARALELPEFFWEPRREELEPEFHRLFSGQERCSPHETEYGPGRSVRKAVELADIAGFYRAFQVGVDAQDPEMVDHISLEFDFLSLVAFKERYARMQGWQEQADICLDAYRKFWSEHLGRWVSGFLDNLGQRARAGGFYQMVSEVAQSWVQEELQRLGLEPGHLEPDTREIPAYECLGCDSPP